MRRIGRFLVSLERAVATGSALALALLLGPGCAMFRGAEPEGSFETVAVVTAGQLDADLKARDTLHSAVVGGGIGAVGGGAIGAGVGAASGAAAGGGVLSLPTGAIGAVVVGGMGAAAGATVGALIGGLQGLPKEKAEQVTRALAGLVQNRDFREELRSAVETALPEDRRAPLDLADARAILEFTELELDQHLHDAISLRVRAKMDLQWGPDPEAPHTRSFDYGYETPERHVDEWLAENGAAFAAGFDEAIDTIARQMSHDILSPPESSRSHPAR